MKSPHCSLLLPFILFTINIFSQQQVTYNTVQDDTFPGSQLPLILIETNGVTIDKGTKEIVDMAVINNPHQLNYYNGPHNEYDGKVGIEYRGSLSYEFCPKKSYNIEIRNSFGMDSTCSLLEMPPEEDWVLNGPYADKSLLRNCLTFQLARLMGHYAPRTELCELFIDGEYEGIYVLMEKIKRDIGRVNIAKLDSSEVSGVDLTGGYIIKVDRSNDGSYTDGWYSPYMGTGFDYENPFFAFHYPKYSQIVQEQKDYIENLITSFENALYGQNYLDAISGYKKFIDIDSFIDFFILTELSRNVDGYRLSTYLYKDKDDNDPLIHMGPLWDYDFTFGNANYYEADSTGGWQYEIAADGWGVPFWWARMMTDPEFIYKLNCRWMNLRKDILSDASIMNLIDTYVSEIGLASDRNFIRWPILGEWIWPNNLYGNTYPEDIEIMKNWIIERTAWMDANMPGPSCTSAIPGDLDESSIIVMVKPNPGFGFTNIEIHNPLKERLEVHITNLSGISVFNTLVEAFLFTQEVRLPQGVYLLRVTGDHEPQTLKIVIQ
jgi:hypothetical protein